MDIYMLEMLLAFEINLYPFPFIQIPYNGEWRFNEPNIKPDTKPRDDKSKGYIDQEWAPLMHSACKRKFFSKLYA